MADLQGFRALLDALERGGHENPYLQKFRDRIQSLRSFQLALCPCNLHNVHDIEEDGRFIRRNLGEILELLRRSNAFGAYRADGTTLTANRSIMHFAPVHVDGCACDPPEARPMSERMKRHACMSYREYIKNIRRQMLA